VSRARGIALAGRADVIRRVRNPLRTAPHVRDANLPPCAVRAHLPLEWAQAALLAANLRPLDDAGQRRVRRADCARPRRWLTGALVVVHAVAAARNREDERPALHSGGMAAPAVPCVYCAGETVGWVTPVRWLGWQDWLGWAQMIAVFWVVLNAIRSRGPRLALFYT